MSSSSSSSSAKQVDVSALSANEYANICQAIHRGEKEESHVSTGEILIGDEETVKTKADSLSRDDEDRSKGDDLHGNGDSQTSDLLDLDQTDAASQHQDEDDGKSSEHILTF